MTDHELAIQLHRDISENPKFTKTDARKKYGVSHSRLTRMEKEGLIPPFYVMSAAESSRKAKAAGKGWFRSGVRA